MTTIKVRYLRERPQKGGHTLYYWWPTKVLQQAGFLPRRVAERTNNLLDAAREAEKHNAELDAWRAGLPVQQGPKANSLPWLIDLYRKSTTYDALSETSRQSYDQAIKEILAWSKRANDPPIADITPPACERFVQEIAKRSHSRANATHRVLRLILQYAVRSWFLTQNPAAMLKIKGLPPRDVVWEAGQVRELCKAARNEKRLSIAIAVLLAVNIGQRQGDILRMAWSQYDGGAITLRQRKTGKLLKVPVTKELKTVLDSAKRTSPTMIVSEQTGAPYKRHNFDHLFREIARNAKLGDHLKFMDLRRTAVVRLANAGCDPTEIAHITGHSYTHTKELFSILEVYLPRNEGVARNAIAKLSEHRKRTELKV